MAGPFLRLLVLLEHSYRIRPRANLHQVAHVIRWELKKGDKSSVCLQYAPWLELPVDFPEYPSWKFSISFTW